MACLLSLVGLSLPSPQTHHWGAHGWNFGEREMNEVILLQSLGKKYKNFLKCKMLSTVTRHSLEVFLQVASAFDSGEGEHSVRPRRP
ncbi:rCG37142, isoform CRA_b [Rattus norvegicus]|uniref:RCG37142, isoform CRA_b n=2 Tax=Rattus norvegicus TaxID=10116 RepID=A6HTV6_RAT|nr:rCG37142, isoform CRA_b [Rattus norvegicus]